MQSFQKHFPPEDARGFYSKLRTEAAVGETTALVPTINASKAQATVESDRVRIFKEIADAIGMEKFNARLQEYLERAMRAAATEALLERGGVESVLAGGSKATLGLLRVELEQTKQLLRQTQSEMKQEVLETKKEVLETKHAVHKTKQELVNAKEETKQELVNAQEETKQELALLTTAQEEASKEAKLMGGRMATLEVKMDAMLELLRGTRGSGTGSQ
jgi:chromosome segregation ATPase